MPMPHGGIHFQYQLVGDIAALLIPAFTAPVATDGLWQHTCFEAFIAVAEEPYYHEFNFSPSRAWAAYAFKQTRVRQAWIATPAPQVECTYTAEILCLDAMIESSHLPPNSAEKPLALGLTAVLETPAGILSYWALNHPAPTPDFHDRAGFTLTLSTF